MPQFAKLSHAECNAIHIAREYAPDDARKTMKREIFSRAKVQFGIPANHKLVTETDVQAENAGLLRNKNTRETYELDATTGKWVGAVNGATAAQRWFRVPKDELHEALVDMLDNMDARGNDDITSQPNPPRGQMVEHDDTKVVIDAQGHAWVQLDADAYETTGHEAEDDDHRVY